MSRNTKTADAVSAVKEPIEKAFSGSGFLLAANEREKLHHDFRWAFEEPGSKVGWWHGHFDDMLDLAYEGSHMKGVAGPLKKVFDSVDEWGNIRDRVDTLQQRMASAVYDLDTSDPVNMQQSLLKLHATTVTLAKDVGQQVDDMKSAGESLKSGVNALSDAVERLKGCWVDFAKEISKDHGSSSLAPDKDWCPHLNAWSNVLDHCDNSLPLCHRSFDRLVALRTQLEERLPAVLRQLPTLCFDLYGNLLAGVTAEVGADLASLRSWGDKLRDWLGGCPTWATEDVAVRKKVHCGEVYYNRNGTRQNSGDDPASVNVASEEDIQVGITRFDFDKNHPVGTKLNVGDPHRANRVWEGRNDKVLFYDSRLSWIEIPTKLRERVQFSWTTLDVEGSNGKGRVFTPGMGEQEAPPFSPGMRQYECSTAWLVRFPQSFASNDVVVRPWIMDFDVSYKQGVFPTLRNWLALEVEEITHDKFRMRIRAPDDRWVSHVRIAYAAYQAGLSIDGFHNEQYHLDVPGRDQFDPQNHDFKPCYFPFPRGKFGRRPAVTAMMSMYRFATWRNYRADMHFATSRDGVVIQGRSWGDTILLGLKFEILAIANE
ncbi:MAG: hypothetical protein M1833_003911 [Piccolia ochrophora]|nr:MAG: hypothetical protein M1833_003911 [Piccolia ochrophora]